MTEKLTVIRVQGLYSNLVGGGPCDQRQQQGNRVKKCVTNR